VSTDSGQLASDLTARTSTTATQGFWASADNTDHGTQDVADNRQQPRMFLSTFHPARVHRRMAGAIVVASAIAFAAVAPFAKVQLAQVWAFIPTYQSAAVVNDLVTATLLFSQFAILRSRALLALASGYLFTAFIAVAHALTFPGLFTPSGLLGAGPQTTAWLYMFWHAGFPLAVIAYAWLGQGERAVVTFARAPRVAILWAIAATFALTCAFTLLATAGGGALPPIMIGHGYTSAMIGVVSSVWLFSVAALAVLWMKRPRSVLDVWILVVLCAWLFDIALSAVLNAGRFDLGFYVGRAYGLLASGFVLIVLLLENGSLYAQLAQALQGERSARQRVQDKTEELNALNTSLEQRVVTRTIELDTANAELKREVGDRKRAEMEARDARQELAGIIDSAMDAIVTVDEQQRIIVFNATAEALFQCPQDQALGSSLARFIPQRFQAAHAEHVRRFGVAGISSRRMAAQRVVTGVRANGTEFPIDASISQVTLNGRKYYTVIVRDVSERVRAEEALQRSRAELHEMARISAEAREQEKSRIARELHDDLAQSLSTLRMDIAWLKDGGAAADPTMLSKLTEMDQTLQNSIQATRRIVANVRPLILDDLGLAPAAEWLVEDFRKRYDIVCTLEVAPPDFDVSDPYATTIFRIMQECLANVGRHANASRVDVKLTRSDHHIDLRIRDDGSGFDSTVPRRPNSFGLVGLRERAHLVNGDIRLDTAPGRGTTVEVRIPLALPAA